MPEKDGKMNLSNAPESSAVIQSLFADAIAKVKTEAAQIMAKIEAEYQRQFTAIQSDSRKALAEEKTRLTETAKHIVKAKVATEERAKNLTERIAILTTEHEEKQQAYSEQITKFKAETEGVIATERARADEAVTAIIKAGEDVAKIKSKFLAKQRSYDEQIAQIKAEKEGVTAKIKAEYNERISTVKSEAAEKIAREKARADKAVTAIAKAGEDVAKMKLILQTKVKSHDEQIAQIGTKAKQETTALAEQLAKLKIEADEAQKSYAKQFTEVKIENEIAIAETKTAAEKMIAQHKAIFEVEAKDIMQKEVFWADFEESVQQILTKMQQRNVEYMMVGRDRRLEGLISKADLKGTLSPYLRPEFAKWRRPLDDATLQIKIKWIMSKPVHTIKPQTPLTVMMKKIYRLRVHALPVVDQQGEVLGLVTEPDVFEAILKSEDRPNSSAPSTAQPEHFESPQVPYYIKDLDTKTSPSPLVSA